MTLIIRAVNKQKIAFFSDGKITSKCITPENGVQKVFKNAKGTACVGIGGFIKTFDRGSHFPNSFNLPMEIIELSNEENYIDSILNTTKTIYNEKSRALDSIFLHSSIENGHFEHSVSKVIKEDGINDSATIISIKPEFTNANNLNNVKFDIQLSYSSSQADLDEVVVINLDIPPIDNGFIRDKFEYLLFFKDLFELDKLN